MTAIGVLLYGPPAAGKDTVTAALSHIDSRYRLAQRLKAGPGRTAGYRMTTIEAIDDLDAAGKIVWRNSRYDAVYATDLPHLEELLDAGYVPVLHLGQPEGIDALTRSAPSITWILVELWCPRDVAVERIVARATGDTEARIAAYDQTKRLATADIRLLTNEKSPRDCAEKIHSYVRDRL